MTYASPSVWQCMSFSASLESVRTTLAMRLHSNMISMTCVDVLCFPWSLWAIPGITIFKRMQYLFPSFQVTNRSN